MYNVLFFMHKSYYNQYLILDIFLSILFSDVWDTDHYSQ